MKPDFSGDYVLDRPACALSSHAAGIVRAELHIEHGDPRFACSARFASENDTIEFTFERFTDGRETGAPSGEGSRCYWDADAIVSEDRMAAGAELMVMTWRYSLTSHGGLRAVERIRGLGRDQDNRWEFTRQ